MNKRKTLHREPKKPTIELKNLDSPDNKVLKIADSNTSFTSSSLRT